MQPDLLEGKLNEAKIWLQATPHPEEKQRLGWLEAVNYFLIAIAAMKVKNNFGMKFREDNDKIVLEVITKSLEVFEAWRAGIPHPDYQGNE